MAAELEEALERERHLGEALEVARRRAEAFEARLCIGADAGRPQPKWNSTMQASDDACSLV